MSLAVEILPQFSARIMLVKGGFTITRNISSPGRDLDHARRLMEKSLQMIWPDWAVTWITQPHEVKP